MGFGFHILERNESIRAKYMALATDVLIHYLPELRPSVIEMLAVLLYLTLERGFNDWIKQDKIRPYGAGSGNTNSLALNTLEELGVIEVKKESTTHYFYRVRKEILERVKEVESKVSLLINNPDLKKLHEFLDSYQKNHSLKNGNTKPIKKIVDENDVP